MNKRLLISCVLAALCSLAFSQKKFSKITEADFALPAEASDSSVDAVYIYRIGDTHFELNESGTFMQTDTRVRIQILTEKGKEYANQAITYYYNEKGSQANNDRVLSLTASSYNLVDGKVVKTNMSSKYQFVEKVNDYSRRTKFTIPEVKVGSIIEYKFTIQSPRYTVIPTWYLQEDDPVRYSFYSATIPEWFKYQVEQRGFAPMKYEKTRTTIQVPMRGDIGKIDATRYVFEAENLTSFKNANFLYSKKDYMQRVEFELSGIEIPGEVYKNYTLSWADVRKSLDEDYDYASTLKMKNPYADEMASLPLEGKPAAVKASLLFAFLKNKLKWDESYKFTPKLSKALKEGKGSNVDLNFIYLSMLRDAGVKATPFVLRLRSQGRLPLTHASMDKLTTCAVAIADENGSLLFADCSANNGDINILPVKLLNDGILYDPNITETSAAGGTRGEIYDLTGIMGNATNTRINVSFNEEGDFVGQRIVTRTGLSSMQYKDGYAEKEDSISFIETKEKNLKCKISSFRLRNGEGVGRACEERIRFTKENMKDGDRIYFNPLVFADETTNYFTDAERLVPVEFPALETTSITSVIPIPEGYAVEELPKAETITLPGYLGATISCEVQENSLVTKYEFEVGKALVPATEYAKLQEFWKDVLRINSLMVCLKKQ